MSTLFSFDLPDAVAGLITPTTFLQYTVCEPDRRLEPTLRELEVEDLFPGGVVDRELAQCCLAGLWLHLNFLDRSHEISQGIVSREGSFWHAIMHRLEGDFWNSKFWYRKVGDHPVFESMPGQRIWNPCDFVDQCEAAKETGDQTTNALQSIAVSEWKTLFEHCFKQAAR